MGELLNDYFASVFTKKNSKDLPVQLNQCSMEKKMKNYAVFKLVLR